MTKTVLVVEDDFDTLHPLAELLRLKGYSVTTASDAELALAAARASRPDLIITDIVLPGKSGLHFILNIRNDEVLKSTPIIVISGCGPMILVEAESAGANCCLEKPLNINLFWDAVRHFFQITEEDPEPVGTGEVAQEIPAAPPATEIDLLVEELRHCSSRNEKEDVLRRLKQQILQLHASNRNCA